jgi:integrase
MAHATSKRCGHGEDSICRDASRNQHIDAVGLGLSPGGTRVRKRSAARPRSKSATSSRNSTRNWTSGWLRGRRRGRCRSRTTFWCGRSGTLTAAAKGTALEAYIVVSLLSRVRTEEARALRWDHVVAWVEGQWQPVTEAGFDHDQVAVFAWRAERAGGDTKTPKSRRTLALPQKCVEALWEHRVRQAKDRLSAGSLWKDHGLVFASIVGTPLDDHNVRRQFPVITEAARLWEDVGATGVAAYLCVAAFGARGAG